MIIDAFTFFNELDLLELRFNILDLYVDKFILVESYQTFSGNSKPLYYLENKERFAKWNDRIIHIIAPNMEIKEELFERHWMCYELIEKEIMKYKGIAFCSDLDEIWNPEILKKVDSDIHSLAQLNYSYYLNNRASEKWVGTLMSDVKNIFIGYNKLNRTVKPNILQNGGWHFTNMGGWEQIVKKVEAYDHFNDIVWALGNVPHYGLKDQMEKNEDYLQRVADYEGQPFKFWTDETDWPPYLKDNKEKFKSLCKS